MLGYIVALPHSVAALGGLLPTLCNVAASFGAHPDQPLPGAGTYVSLALYAIIGIIVSFALSPTDRKQAFAIGISAPAIVASLASGATKPPQVSQLNFSIAAYAQDSANSNGNMSSGNPSIFLGNSSWTDKNNHSMILNYSTDQGMDPTHLSMFRPRRAAGKTLLWVLSQDLLLIRAFCLHRRIQNPLQ